MFTPQQSRSVYSIFQSFASFKCRSFSSSDFNGRTRLRVPAFTSGALTNHEGSEADQRNFVVIGQSIGNALDNGIHCTRSICFAQTRTLGYVVNQFRFVHMKDIPSRLEIFKI